jgi:hypothetical protein
MIEPAALTLEQKASLLSGRDFWSTTPIEDAGVPSIVLTDRLHGVRKQAGAAKPLGVNDSEPATCFPPAVAVGSSWDPLVAARWTGSACGRNRRWACRCCSGPASTSSGRRCATQFRVLLRRPVPFRVHGARPAGRGYGRLVENWPADDGSSTPKRTMRWRAPSRPSVRYRSRMTGRPSRCTVTAASRSSANPQRQCATTARQLPDQPHPPRRHSRRRSVPT